uniref:Uncharacterized protein n=1 Tax=Chromera velia CCMP2878 TaxID=1169474 RepID=A0A0G4FJ29_9ALVE|eukprot:Cvel_17208.t1-p1 / transcript=Cvel_17208.t1 / gene=Cvel_17208 / organism=Chromera_velia_CCMP2878 / gene_product=hypothetical protein / transcript_product=hypothetical protein / location=Cvel_scaffold1361:12678-13178(+) / protein_length=167 / sequence_SO=supercontig / SO=protein_coding / is_pseudo=false
MEKILYGSPVHLMVISDVLMVRLLDGKEVDEEGGSTKEGGDGEGKVVIARTTVSNQRFVNKPVVSKLRGLPGFRFIPATLPGKGQPVTEEKKADVPSSSSAAPAAVLKTSTQKQPRDLGQRRQEKRQESERVPGVSAKTGQAGRVKETAIRKGGGCQRQGWVSRREM